MSLLTSLPQHQQLLLCSIVLHARRTCGTDAASLAKQRCTLADLHGEYKDLCTAQHLPSLRKNEVLPLCQSLASLGVFGIGNIARAAKAVTSTKAAADFATPVWLMIAEDDLKRATQEVRFFRQILEAGQ